MRYQVAIVDDDPANLESLERILTSDGADVSLFTEPRSALKAVQNRSFDLLLTDLRMDSLDGITLLETAKGVDPALEVILITAYGTVEVAVEAIKKGAYDFITKPLQKIGLLKSIHRALEKRRLVNENLLLKEALQNHTSLNPQIPLGRSDKMREMMEIARQAAHSSANVLIEGESGTGKGILAEYLHRQSDRAASLFVKINCTAIPENLLEAELFGYEAGAFTGASKRKKGRVELAHGGTLFLDEIGIAPLTLQSKLLRFLQEGEFERLGSNETHRVETRVISATNSNLKRAIAEGRLREDLFYRLNVIHIHVPPLRERVEDIPLLAKKFLEDLAKKNGRAVPLIHPDALTALIAYSWPGNIRELQNVMERAVVLNRTGTIETSDLPKELGGDGHLRSIVIPMGLSLREVERLVLDETLRGTRGDRKRAAQLLGIHPRTIHRHLGQVDTLTEDEI